MTLYVKRHFQLTFCQFFLFSKVFDTNPLWEVTQFQIKRKLISNHSSAVRSEELKYVSQKLIFIKRSLKLYLFEKGGVDRFCDSFSFSYIVFSMSIINNQHFYRQLNFLQMYMPFHNYHTICLKKCFNICLIQIDCITV